jgi:hypothetical protein
MIQILSEVLLKCRKGETVTFVTISQFLDSPILIKGT